MLVLVKIGNYLYKNLFYSQNEAKDIDTILFDGLKINTLNDLNNVAKIADFDRLDPDKSLGAPISK